jgi:signal transduction histidine kinase/CheY-like chemotaxis protein
MGKGNYMTTVSSSVAVTPLEAGKAQATLAESILHERVSGARDEIPTTAFLIVVGALSLGWVLRKSIPVNELYIWVSLQSAFAAACFWLAHAYLTDEKRFARAGVWAFRFNAMVVVGGLLWSWVPVWLATMEHPLLQLVAGAILVGVPLLGVTTNRYFAAGQVGLVVVFLGSFVAYLAFVSDASLRLEIAVGCVIYAIVMVWMGVRAQLATTALLMVQLQREGLIDQLQRAKNQSDSANRAKSEFIANMSHELRTPLTVVLGMAQLLRLSELDAEQREGVDLIERSGQALLSLVNHILDLSRIDAGRLELAHTEFDIRKTIDGVRRHFAGDAADKGVELNARVAEDVPQWVQGDELRLRQVLLNLCDNAVKFTLEGSVTLSAEVSRKDGPAGHIVLGFTITDTGVGMDKNAVAHAFEPFFQVHTSAARSFGGTGLGLAISRRLVRLMGGTISLKSELGRGSTFSFTAAFIPATVQHATESGSLRLARDLLPVRVLLVEDDPVNSLVASSLLRTIAAQVDVADGGEEALRAVQAHPYDVILMDCVMRGIDGYEAVRRIRALERAGTVPRSHIVALTASALPEDRERALASGMDAYVSKPYTLEDLKEALLGAEAQG